MLKIYKLLLVLVFISLFSGFDAGNKKRKRNTRSNRGETTDSSNKFADDRLNANYAINNPDYTVGNQKSVTKQNWVYKHSPRSGSLFIRTNSGKVLYPGELNTIRNAVKFEDFLDDFYYQLPNAKANTRYSVVGYSEGYIAKAHSDLRGEDLYQGTKGDNLGAVFQGLNKDEVGNLIAKDTKYCIEVLEQNPNEHLSKNNQNDWFDPKHKWGKELSGTAGKTCFVVLPKGMEELDKDFYSEFELIIATFESHQKLSHHGDTGTSGDRASDIATSSLDEAIARQRRAAYVGSPSRNKLYFENGQSDVPFNQQNYQDTFERPSSGYDGNYYE